MNKGLLIPFLFSVMILSGCSTLGMASAASALTGGGGPSVDAEMTVGDKNQTVDTDFGKKQNQQAEVINNTDETDHILVLIAVIGWLLPGPHEIWRGLTNLLPWRRRNK